MKSSSVSTEVLPQPVTPLPAVQPEALSKFWTVSVAVSTALGSTISGTGATVPAAGKGALSSGPSDEPRSSVKATSTLTRLPSSSAASV